jgi:metal-responsive CopG/Arc/MetJ family transcriptional regulator
VAKVKIDKDLFERIKRHAEEKGYASLEEFVAHTLETAVAGEQSDESEEERRKKLEGLGYIG